MLSSAKIVSTARAIRLSLAIGLVLGALLLPTVVRTAPAPNGSAEDVVVRTGWSNGKHRRPSSIESPRISYQFIIGHGDATHRGHRLQHRAKSTTERPARIVDGCRRGFRGTLERTGDLDAIFYESNAPPVVA